MTQLAMRRTIEKAKQDLVLLKPKPPVHYKLVAGLRDSASEAQKEAHQVELAALEAAGINVILLVPVSKLPTVLPRRRPIPALT